MKKVYLDTNVFSHVTLRAAGIDEEQVSKFASAVSSQIIIPLSVVLLDEVISAFQSRSNEANQILDLIKDWCELDLMFKPSDQLLREDIEAFVAGKTVPTSFFESQDKLLEALKSFFAGPHSVEQLRPVIDTVSSQKDDFYNGMAEASEQIITELGIQKGKKLPRFQEGRPPTFEEYFEGVAPSFAEAAAERVGLLDESRRLGIDKLLRLKSVRVFAGISASWAYSQIIESRKLQRSAGYDMRHAVLASVTDVLISNDEEFRRLVKRIPGLKFEVKSFTEFVLEF